jgi:predicted RNA binding protein YcfA (HicA-like mRNA interferase family)
VSQKGSHIKLGAVRGGRTWTVIVKHPAAEVPSDTFTSVLKQAGLSRQVFEDLL